MTKEDDDFGAMLAEFEQDQPAPNRRRPKVGDVVSGPIVSIGAEAVFIELGAKAEAMLELEQVRDREGNITVSVGDVIEARVVDTGGKSGTVLLRRTLGRGPDAVNELAQAFEHGMPVQGLVTGVNKGGVDVQIAGQRAFCPVSQLDLRFVENPETHVGQHYEFRITKLSESRGRADIVVSRRALLEEAASIEAEATRAVLQEGALLDGIVTAIKPFGAFVDIGGLEGMIHISELGHTRVEKPEDVLAVGQRVKVFVLKVEKTGDAKRPEKIALSLKALENDPWDDLVARFGEGSRVSGTVVRTQPFGAFVELAPGLEGLVHISELGAGRRINHPREVVKEGQAVEVTVLSIDPAKRRIALSMDAEKIPVAPEDRPVAPEAPRSLGTLADLFKQGR